MVDLERVVTLDDLMDRVPEELVRDAESRRVEETKTIGDTAVTKELSKAKRIRAYLDNHPEARNKDAVEALSEFGVTAADVANVKSHQKRTQTAPGKKSPSPAKVKPEVASPNALSNNGPTINWKELEAGVAFVKAAGSVQRAKHLLIIIDQIKDC
jgi:hypothetical protein